MRKHSSPRLLQQPLTANRIRNSVSPASLTAAIKNPVIPVVNNSINSNKNDENQSSSLYEQALFDTILSSSSSSWMEQVEIFRQYHGLPASSLLKNKNKNNKHRQLPKNWWLQYAPFIHPSFWSSSLQQHHSYYSPSNLSLIRNQFSMVPLQSYGDAVISLSLSTMDFTLISPRCAAAAAVAVEGNDQQKTNINNHKNNNNNNKSDHISKGTKLIKKEREQMKNGLQDAEFICSNIVGAPRRKIQIGDKKDKNTSRILEVPSWKEDLLLMCKPSDLMNQKKKGKMMNNNDEKDEEYLALQEEACVGSFVAFIGAISVEFGVDTASKLMWKMAATAEKK